MDKQAFETIKNEETKPVTMPGAQAIIESLIHEDVKQIFGYQGGAIMPVYDVLYSYSHKLKHILVRHEQGAVHAAQGFARVSGEVGVSLVTSGPGATNTVTGIADAMMDSTPVVVITGQVGSSLLGTDAFQETDIVGITKPITKWNYQVKRAEDIPWAIARAFYIARTGRPGPVLLDITKDAQFTNLDYVYHKIKSIRSYTPVPKINKRNILTKYILNKTQWRDKQISKKINLGKMKNSWYSRNKKKVLQKLKKKYQDDKEFREKARKRYKERYHSDEEYREKTRQRARERYHNDKNYRQATIERAKKRNKKANPNNKKKPAT